jgi:hypothetical protein
VGQRVGRERAHRNEKPGDVPHAEMQERDAVVPGERRIGHEGRQARQQVAVRRDRGEARPNRLEGEPSEFPVEKPTRNDDRRQPDEGPQKLTYFFHEAVRPLP